MQKYFIYEKYNKIFNEFKEFIKNNATYKTKVAKYNTNSKPPFPLITVTLSDNKDTDYCTTDKIEKYESLYLTIDIYTKDKNLDDGTIIASDEINEELSMLTMIFFGEKLNMKKTLNKPTPNLDTSILRKTIQYQCLIGNARGNIIRR